MKASNKAWDDARRMAEQNRRRAEFDREWQESLRATKVKSTEADDKKFWEYYKRKYPELFDNEDKETTIELLILKRELTHSISHRAGFPINHFLSVCDCLSLGLVEQAKRNKDATSKTRKELQISQLGNCIIRCALTHGGDNCISLFSNNSKTTHKLFSIHKTAPNA